MHHINPPNPKLSILNRHPSVLQGPVLLHELVRASSNRPAIDFLEHGSRRRILCYKALHALSDALAGKITGILAKLESASPIIPVFLPQGPELYIALLAILKAGKAFCPLNLDTPAERLMFILRDVSADLIITTSIWSDKIRATTAIRALHVDDELLERDHHSIPQLPQVDHNNLAYVLYTSGSTGLPKAVSVSHRAVTQSLLAHDRHIPDFDRFLQFAAPTFDVSIFEIFFPWFRGRTLVGCTRAQMLDDLPRIIRVLEIDAAELTPTVVSNLLHGRSSVPTLKLLLTIGEMLTQHVVDEYGGNESVQSMLWAMYGPTEAAIHCTLQPRLSALSPTGMIGTPLDTVSIFIVAPFSESGSLAEFEVLPVGSVGELVVGGPQIAQEYLNRPELTAASFIDHPEYGRLYRTGDRAKLRGDGNLECLGRVVVGQVKLRGQRVELGEVENVIMKMDACRTAVVMVIEEVLVAFCATDSREVSRAEILETCNRWLPSFMVPSDVLLISSLPQLPSGKIDKRALESTYLRTLHRNGAPRSEPDDHVDDAVSRILAEHTTRNLGLDSALASSGLNSLQSIRIASALRQEGYNLGAMDILMATTLRDLIAVCKTRKVTKGVETHTNILPIPGSSIENPYFERWHADLAHVMPCTPLQEAMLAETTARPSAYCNWIEVELPISRTYDQIRDILRSLAQANDILRTGFHSTSQYKGIFAQLVWKDLIASQIQEVARFSRAFSLGSVESLLRPLTVQVKTGPEKPRLLFQIHHALYDGWSFDLLLQDLDKLMHGEQAVQRPQYRDIVQYYTREQQASEEETAKEYWASLLCDHIPTPLPNYNGKIIHTNGVRAVSGRSAIAIDSLFDHADKLAINPQVFFQAATAYVLSLYTGSSDIVLGNVISGRTIPVTGVENIMGPCIAALPMRLDFQRLSRAQDVFQRIQSLNRESLQHGALPLRDIARATKVQPGTRLFDVLFVWQQSLSVTSESSNVARIIDSADDLEYKITLEFEPRKDCISFRATFDPSTIPENQIKYLSRQIDQVVQLFLQDTNCLVTDINLCFTDDSRSIANPDPPRSSINHGPSYTVEKWAMESPDKTAVVFGHIVNGVMEIKDSMTYGILNSRANQLARVLSAHGVGQDQLVGVIMEKSIDLYVSILAILKVGVGYLPMVPDTPRGRISTILDDAKISVCICESAVSTSLRQNLATKFIDLDFIDLSSYSDQDIRMPYHGSHLAYAIFTSGSTGKPKGVLVTQDNLMSNLEYLSTVYPFSAESRMLQACSQAFDVSVFEIFFSWYVGICLCTAKKDDLFRDLEAAINCLDVTHLSLTPTVAALVNPKNVPKVEFLVTAGEALTERVRREWAGRGLCQGYGPSETTNICTINMSVSSSDVINNIGPPFSNTSAFVLDPDSDSILPRGAVGELCFGGAQVFRGYLNNPKLNSAKIIQHPSYGRMYRSGDTGILLADDSILFAGRLDDQVKIRGHRVELGEITSIVLDHDRIRDCVSLLVSLPNNAKSLVTFWVPTALTSESVEILELGEFRSVIMEAFTSLIHRLPSYMVPSHLVPISRIPMTTQAKIDTRLLHNLFDSLPKDALIYTTEPQDVDKGGGPSSEWEKKAIEVLARTLDLPLNEIRRTTSFFSLGLDSLSAISFCTSLRTVDLGDFDVSLVLKNPTIAQLASAKETSASLKSSTRASTIDPTCALKEDQVSQIRSLYKQDGIQIAKVLPCTPLQEAMLSTERSSSGSAYCNVLVFHITGDVSRLQECWALMVQRHDILRTSFMATEDPSYAFAQVVLKDYTVSWHHQGLQGDVQSRANEIVMGLLEARKPPVYLALAQKEASTKLLFCCHHALYDGIAITTVLQEIQDSYSGCELPPPISYEVYLQHMLSQDFDKADQYWTALLKDCEPTLFPSLTGQAIKAGNGPASLTRCLQMPLSEVRQACKSASISLLSVAQAAWAKILHFYTGESDICFGNVVSGRALPRDDVNRLVAPCFNTLPVRLNFDFHERNSTLTDLLHTINVEALAFQLTPLRRIQNILLKDGGRLFDTLVIVQQPSTQLDNSIWTLEQDMGEMDVPIVCEVFQDHIEDTLKLVLHYHTSLLSAADATIVAETFDNSLSTLIKFPQSPANDTLGFPAHLRAESNTDFQAFDIETKLLHSGFERITMAQPDHIALDFLHADGARTVWSFKELSERANSIAHYLIDRGVGPEHIIPIHMPKSPQFYASVLGILKAGAAFAPVHPELPEARKQFMLTELEARIVLCSTDHCLPKACTEAQAIQVDTIKPCSKPSPTISSKESNLAYCLFTSGSTGLPKAVSMEHRAPIQTIESSRSLVPWDSSSRLLQYAAVTFDMCYYDCFLAWTFGFTLCAAEQSEMLNELPKVINALEVDLLDLTPSIAVSLRRSELPKVKWLYCIGEIMPFDIVKEWVGACVNSYGPTEAAFCTTMFLVTKQSNTSVIGKPFPTTSFAIFPPRIDRPLPLLSIGELYIGGAQLARCYLGKSQLTRERFVSKCGQRFYKSGDIVRMLGDGNFEFIGRADDQVKIRGLRVELGEINHVLQDSHSDIKTAVTQILKKDATAKEQLVAFLVTTRELPETARIEIREALEERVRSRLPVYMVPQFFLFVDIIPRSMAGKVDKNALTRTFREAVDVYACSNGIAEHGSEHRWTPLENQVRDIFARLSQASLKDILPTTSMYQVGLDSISAVQIAAALRRQGHIVAAADVMKHMTCTAIAACINRSSAPGIPTTPYFDFSAFEYKHKALVLGACGIDNAKVEAIRPCTPLQEGMLSLFVARDGAYYMNHLRLQLEPNVDLKKMKEAWTMMMNRHTMLRTGFAHIQDIRHPFVMIQYHPMTVDLPWVDTREIDMPDSTNDWLRKLQRRSLSRLQFPPWALRVVQERTNVYLDIGIFHGLFDAQSLQSVFYDVTAAYYDQSLPELVPLDPVISGFLSPSEGLVKSGERFWAQLGQRANPCRFPNLAPLRYDPKPSMLLTKQSARPLTELEMGCQRANITLQVAGVASWLSLLSAYTGEQTVTCGVVLSGRSFEGAEDAVFPCINTVPFACTISKESKDVLDAVMELNTEIQRHQSTPLTDIRKLMGYPNEPLFDSIFAYQRLLNNRRGEFPWRVIDEQSTIEYPISIELEPKHDHMEYRLTFLPHIIPIEQASLILDQVDHLMERYIFLETAPTIEPSFAKTLYSITPARNPHLPSEASLLHELVESTAMKYPERMALEFVYPQSKDGVRSKKWTYTELDAEGNMIAYLLFANGVQPGDMVGVCFDKCPEASFAMLGILKAGCAFVAIDPGAPAARQAFIVRDSQARVILSMSAQSSRFRESVGVPIVNLDEAAVHAVSRNNPLPRVVISPQDYSYCLYTSGTTGSPKGCLLTHENAVQALLAFQRLFSGHWNEKSRWLQFASFHFDVSILEQYWSWSVGICVVSAPRDLIFEDLAMSIRTLGITHIDLTPSLAQVLHPDDVPSLCKGVFITGGESLKQEILDVWGSKNVIYNGYGPTEATIGVTMYPRVPSNGKPSNIGRQFDNVGSFVLQPGSDVPVLRGGVGELCVSGKLVGRGYLNRPNLTEERFPYLQRYKERVYRTGDLVRILFDGTFDFLGRADDQVKLRGQRLEIGEINSVIKQAGNTISDVATLVLKHPKQQKEQLVSFIVLRKTTSGRVEVLLSDASGTTCAKAACHEKLPPYMVPTHFVPLTSMPLNINNKADAKQLKAIYHTLSASDLQKLSVTSSGHSDVWSKQDKKLREVLVDALGVDEDVISRDSSFFELGMDSISVIGVSRAMRHAGFTDVTASVVMSCPTIRQLLKALETGSSTRSDRGSLLAAQQIIIAVQHRHRRTVAHSLSIDPSTIEALAPCTPLQQGMIARFLESDNGLYFNDFRFQLNDNVNEAKLRAAWENVFASTQILRTVFANTEDGYVQAVLHENSLHWSRHTLTKDENMTEYLHEMRQKWLQLNRIEIRQPFQILFITTPTQRQLVVHIFHGLYDGNSIEHTFRLVWDAYTQQNIDHNVPSFHSALPHGPLRVAEGARTFWLESLPDMSYIGFPALVDNPSKDTIVVTRELHALTSFESTRRKLNVTAQAIAQACWHSVLQEYVKGTVTTGVVVSGRSIDLVGADRIIGPMFNTIPYQHHLQSSKTWADVIKKVHDFNTAAYRFQHTPLRDIMKWCKRNPSQPLFDTLFVYQIGADEENGLSTDAWEICAGDTIADYPLALEIEQKANHHFSLALVSQGHISNQQTSIELLDRFEKTLRLVLADPMTMIGLPVLINGATKNATSGEKHTMNGSSSMTGFIWTEDALKIKEEIAHLSNIGSEDINDTTSIFELGLDSIDAIKLSSKLRNRSVYLPVSGIMRGLTIARMIQNISDDKMWRDERSTEADLGCDRQGLKGYVEQRDFDTTDAEDVLFLTPLQEAMVAEMVASEYTRYYNHDVLKLAASTDVDELRKAWTRVVQASPILRTSFIKILDPKLDASFAQIVHKTPHTFWSQTKVEKEPNFQEVFEALRSEAVNFALHEPLFHILVIEAPTQTYLVLSISHALYDGWSLGLLHSDIHNAYHDQYTPRPGYVPFLLEILSTSGSDAASFWQDFLLGAKPSLFQRRLEAAFDNYGRTHRHQQRSQTLLSDVLSFVKKSNISLQALGQTIFALVLASYTRSLDVSFGSVLLGRDDELSSQLLFPTMNTVAIRVILHGTGNEMLRYVQDNLTSIKRWQHFPLRKISSLVGIDGRLFEALFVYQRGLEEGNNQESRLYTSIESQSDVEYLVCVEMEVVKDELIWRCAVKEEVLSAEEAKELLNRLNDVLGHIIDRPNTPVIEMTSHGASVCGLGAFEEEQEDPRTFNDTSTDQDATLEGGPESQTVHEICEVLAAVSKIPRDEVTKDMTIFHIGLDSISAIKVSSLLRNQNIVLSVGEMLQAGTVEKMARIVDTRTVCPDDENSDYQSSIAEALQNLDHADILHRAGVDDASVAEMLPVTAGQLYALSMWLNMKDSTLYPSFHYRIQGSATFEVLQNSWQALVSANPILRTCFLATRDDHMPYVQIVLQKFDTTAIDTTGLDDDQISNTRNELISRQPWAHFIVSQTSDEWRIELKIHHALYDGVSIPLLMAQFQDLCNNVTVPLSNDSFTKFVATSSTAIAHRDREVFWKEYLKAARQQCLCRSTTAPEAKMEIFKPGLLQTSMLEALARDHGTSVQLLFIASYAKQYAILTGAGTGEDVFIGVYLANRSLPIKYISSAAVPTVNILPLRVSTPKQHDIVALATQIQRDLQKISDPVNASASLFEISEWTGVKIDTFVNFLTLPSTEEADKSMQSDAGIKVQLLSQWEQPISRVSAIDNMSWKVFSELQNDKVSGAYLHAINVEAAIRNGVLDVGLFARTDLLSLEQGEKLMEDIRRTLAAVTNK
ncbi:Nn.00g059980.m01.CDS01 [Neocucurbitaria sp. VM-36]